MSDQDMTYEETMIDQDHSRGPGWFLKISYIIIIAFCIYYFFEYRDWKSNYDDQQEQIRTELEQK